MKADPTITPPKAGWYVLTAAVKNPAPDKRSKDKIECRAEWPAGTRVRIVPDEPFDIAGTKIDPLSGRIFLIASRSHGYVRYALRGDDLTPRDVAGNGILDVIEMAPATLGQLLSEHNAEPAMILAMAINGGLLSLDQIRSLQEQIAPMDDDQYTAECRKHWLP